MVAVLLTFEGKRKRERVSPGKPARARQLDSLSCLRLFESKNVSNGSTSVSRTLVYRCLTHTHTRCGRADVVVLAIWSTCNAQVPYINQFESAYDAAQFESNLRPELAGNYTLFGQGQA